MQAGRTGHLIHALESVELDLEVLHEPAVAFRKGLARSLANVLFWAVESNLADVQKRLETDQNGWIRS